MRFLRSAGRLHLEFLTFRGSLGALRSRSQTPVPSQIFIHRRNLGDFRPKGAGNHYIFLGGRDLEKGPWVSYLPFGRRFRCGCRYRCGGPYSFPGPSALCRGCAQAGRGGEGQQYGLGAMTTAKPLPPLAPGETRGYPVLPLRDLVVFPHMIAPLFVGRKKSILALEEVMRSDTFILLATQKNASDDGPRPRPFTRSARLRACCICSSSPTAPLRYWSRALSARKWSSTPIAASITRSRRSRSATRWGSASKRR